MKELTKYFDLQEKIFKHIGYEENWRVYPLDDQTDQYWMIIDHEVIHGDTVKDIMDDENGNYYSSSLLRDRFLKTSIYRGNKYTGVLVDTQVDGNRFLTIFANSKEISESREDL